MAQGALAHGTLDMRTPASARAPHDLLCVAACQWGTCLTTWGAWPCVPVHMCAHHSAKTVLRTSPLGTAGVPTRNLSLVRSVLRHMQCARGHVPALLDAWTVSRHTPSRTATRVCPISQDVGAWAIQTEALGLCLPIDFRFAFCFSILIHLHSVIHHFSNHHQKQC